MSFREVFALSKRCTKVPETAMLDNYNKMTLVRMVMASSHSMQGYDTTTSAAAHISNELFNAHLLGHVHCEIRRLIVAPTAVLRAHIYRC